MPPQRSVIIARNDFIDQIWLRQRGDACLAPSCRGRSASCMLFCCSVLSPFVAGAKAGCFIRRRTFNPTASGFHPLPYRQNACGSIAVICTCADLDPTVLQGVDYWSSGVGVTGVVAGGASGDWGSASGGALGDRSHISPGGRR